MPLVKPVTAQVRGPPDQAQVCPPGVAVTVYESMDAPPLEIGGDHVTVAWLTPAVAATLRGADGSPGTSTHDTTTTP